MNSINFDHIQDINLNDDDDQYGSIGSPIMMDNKSKFNQNIDTIEDPIFALQDVEYKANGILSMLVSNGKLIIATNASKIIRLDFDREQEIEEIDFNRRPGEIYKIFLDPSGHHLLISMINEDVYYLHSTWKKPKLQKWKDLIESVAWDPSPDKASNLQSLLIGTNKGKIWESVVTSVEKGFLDFGNKEPILKLLHSLDDPEPVLGMSLEKVQNKFFLMISTMTRLYYLIGGPSFENLFDRDHVIFDIMPNDTPIPKRHCCGELKLYSKSGISLPQAYAWLIPSGIHYGDVIYGAQNTGDKFTTSTMMLHFNQEDEIHSRPPTSKTTKKQQQQQQQTGTGNNGNNNNNSQQPSIPPYPPISFALSQFHFLLLYEDRFIALSKLNYQIVYEYYFNPNAAKLRGISVDHFQQTTWIYGENIVYELRIIEEDRYAWKLYMEKGQFDMALAFAKDPFINEKRNQIWATQADHYFNDGRFELSATFYGKTHRVFEEITLKFINVGQRDALKTYLLQKLQNLNKGFETQKTIICTWLIEIFISKLNTLRDPVNKDKYSKVNAEFRQFLENYKDTLIIIKEITFNIISSHGAIDELLFYANLIEDYERVISYHIQHQQYGMALNILTTLDKPRQNQQQQQQQRNNYNQQQNNIANVPQPDPDELYYKFCPILFHFIPTQTCEAWIQTKPGFLDPRKLIPSLMRYDHSKTNPGEPNQAIRYLQYCVQKQKNTDKAVHNYLLSLYVKQEDDKPLLDFLNGKDVNYDLKYALRLCMKERKLKACVYIYSAMELYEEAVDLALEVDIDLAKDNADKVKDDDEALCKKLWLRIARHKVEKDKDIKEAMDFLKACPLLKIEDILPFFPEFTVIDDFKEEICKSLEDYNSYIDVLKSEMDDATNSADLIRKDIQNLRNKYGHVKSDQKCDICNYPVLTKRFYLFSCQHVFHSDCLITEITKHVNNETRERIRDLQMSVSVGGGGGYNTNSNNVPNAADTFSSMMISSEDQISQEDIDRSDLDRLVGKECIYCGDIMIRSIEKPFIGSDELETLSSWEI